MYSSQFMLYFDCSKWSLLKSQCWVRALMWKTWNMTLESLSSRDYHNLNTKCLTKAKEMYFCLIFRNFLTICIRMSMLDNIESRKIWAVIINCILLISRSALFSETWSHYCSTILSTFSFYQMLLLFRFTEKWRQNIQLDSDWHWSQPYGILQAANAWGAVSMLLNLRELTNLIVQIGSLPRRVPCLTCFQEQVG